MSVRSNHVQRSFGPASAFAAGLREAWARPFIGAAAATGSGLVVGLLSAQFLPRGPVTAGQGLAVMLSGLALGLVAGFAWPSRAAGLLAMLAYMAAFEIGRL
ncbi:MAG TPA: hypothetical protein VIU37_01970, partial [Candidatus Limnocylindrales bacterium]